MIASCLVLGSVIGLILGRLSGADLEDGIGFVGTGITAGLICCKLLMACIWPTKRRGQAFIVFAVVVGIGLPWVVKEFWYGPSITVVG